MFIYCVTYGMDRENIDMMYCYMCAVLRMGLDVCFRCW